MIPHDKRHRGKLNRERDVDVNRGNKKAREKKGQENLREILHGERVGSFF